MSSEKKLKITSFGISVPVFTLNAGFVGKFYCANTLRNLVFLVSVFSPPVCFKMGVTGTHRQFTIDAGNNALAAPCVVFTDHAAGLQGNPVPVEHRVELVKG